MNIWGGGISRSKEVSEVLLNYVCVKREWHIFIIMMMSHSNFYPSATPARPAEHLRSPSLAFDWTGLQGCCSGRECWNSPRPGAQLRWVGAGAGPDSPILRPYWEDSRVSTHTNRAPSCTNYVKADIVWNVVLLHHSGVRPGPQPCQNPVDF